MLNSEQALQLPHRALDTQKRKQTLREETQPR
jgi:hypothetical protein